MIFSSLMKSRAALTMASGLALAAGFVVFHAKADEWNKKTILTVNQTIQISDRVLEPGQYVMKLYNSQSDRHVVQIFNADQTHIIGTVLAIPAQRLEPTGDTQFTFWETPAGKARAMRKWFYPGDLFGQEFPYPKHLTDVAMMESRVTPAPAPTPAPVTEQAQPEQPSTAETNNNMETEQQPQVAEAAPPPPEPQSAPPAPAENPPAPAPQPRELPKTGSPYPLIGALGGVLFALYGLLRIRRLA